MTTVALAFGGAGQWETWAAAAVTSTTMALVAVVTAVAVVAKEKAERERDAAAVQASVTAATEDMEERAEARFGEAPAEEMDKPEVPQRCERTMIHICPTYPFGTGKTCVLSYWGQSSPQSRISLFSRTDTCADCAGRTASVKTCMFPPSQTWWATLTRLFKTARRGMMVAPTA